MAFKKRPLAPRLPQNIIEEINAEENKHGNKGRRGPQLSRKEARKLDRANKKQKRAEFFSHASTSLKRPADDEHVESPKRKKTRHDDTSVQSSQPRLPAASAKKSKLEDGPSTVPEGVKKKPTEKGKEKGEKGEGKSKPTPLEKLTNGLGSSAKPPRKSRVEEEEDAYIAYLESRLGYSGDKKKKKSNEDDGLDDLLDLVDNIGIPSATNNEDGSDGGDMLEYEEESGSETTTEESENEDDEITEDEQVDDGEDEWGGIDEQSSGEEDETNKTPQQVTDIPKPVPGTAYVPPHLRKTQVNEQSEEMLRLTRQVKGLLNRMSEQNLGTILDGIEEIYRNHRRNDVTSTITNFIIEGVSSHSLLLDSYVVLHAAFVSSLHKIIGIEFGAHFVQNVVISYEKHYETLKATPTTPSDPVQDGQDDPLGKECSNLIVLLSELYNFQVISCVLVFDLIRGFLNDDLSEFNVELLLKIVRNSGQQLRLDDPTALRDIIAIVQDKVASKGSDISSRTRFMIETLTNLKNNKLKRNTTQNQGAPALERMRKFLSGLGKRKHILAHEPLRVSLADLHSAETKGKWWLVGAAWGGDPLVEKQDDIAKSKLSGQVEEVKDPHNDLLQLARKQGMNTDIRRSIFVTLMSSEDYVDACERLSQLNLTEMQQREIIRVILHCCGNEKTYNPYYALVGQHLCRTAHSYKITLQFSLWDFLRSLGETTVGGAEVVKNARDEDGFDVKTISKTRLRNVARAYGWWIAKDSVSLTVLKPVDFTALKPQSREFLGELTTQIFICSQTSTPLLTSGMKGVPTTRNRSAIEEIFVKGSRVQALAFGMVYFLTENFRDVSYEDENVTKFMNWAVKLAKDTLRVGLDVIPTL